MSAQHTIHEFRVAFDQLPTSEGAKSNDLKGDATKLRDLIQQVSWYVQDARSRNDDGLTEDAASAVQEAETYINDALQGDCHPEYKEGGICTMCYNMAESSLESALDDLENNARALAEG